MVSQSNTKFFLELNSKSTLFVKNNQKITTKMQVNGSGVPPSWEQIRQKFEENQLLLILQAVKFTFTSKIPRYYLATVIAGSVFTELLDDRAKKWQNLKNDLKADAIQTKKDFVYIWKIVKKVSYKVNYYNKVMNSKIHNRFERFMKPEVPKASEDKREA